MYLLQFNFDHAMMCMMFRPEEDNSCVTGEHDGEDG